MKSAMQILSAIFLVVAISSCGLSNKQVATMQSFGTATSNIGKLSEDEFLNIRNGIIEMNQTLVAIDYTKKAGSLRFDRPASVEATTTRVAASKALRLYGDLLVKLVTEDRTENIQKVVNSLVDNTSAALKKELSDEKKDAINKMIVKLSSFWLEKKKADAVREIVLVYQQPVDELADLIRKDLSLDDGSFGFLKAYHTTAKRLKNASIRLVNAGNKYSVLERDRAVQALVMAEKAISRATEIGKKSKQAIAGLKKANLELVEIIKNKKYATGDIKAYAKQIQKLVNLTKVLAN